MTSPQRGDSLSSAILWANVRRDAMALRGVADSLVRGVGSTEFVTYSLVDAAISLFPLVGVQFPSSEVRTILNDLRGSADDQAERATLVLQDFAGRERPEHGLSAGVLNSVVRAALVVLKHSRGVDIERL